MTAILGSGRALSAEHTRIAEIIKDYDETLELAWVPPENRELNEQFPFAIVHKPVGAPEYIAMRLRENEVDHRVLARLWSNDNKNLNVLDSIELEEAALKIVNYHKQMEKDEENRELAAWAVKTKAGSKHNGVRYE